MFINYLSLMLVNMAAGLMVLAGYLFWGLDGKEKACEACNGRGWAAAFFATGMIAFCCGLHMTLTWPLPGSYNIAFGEPSVLLGILFLSAALTVAQGWGLIPVCIYAVFAGITSVVVGVSIIGLNLTKAPLVAGAGFILTGAAAILFAPSVWFRRNQLLRSMVILFLVVSSGLWMIMGVKAYQGHLAMFVNWQPVTSGNK